MTPISSAGPTAPTAASGAGTTARSEQEEVRLRSRAGGPGPAADEQDLVRILMSQPHSSPTAWDCPHAVNFSESINLFEKLVRCQEFQDRIQALFEIDCPDEHLETVCKKVC